MEYRIERDSMGEMKVPADRYWAAQTERSHENFRIGVGIETMPREITHAFGVLKKAAAMAPVQAPVPGRGTATKSIRPRYLYFVTLRPFRWALRSSLSTRRLSRGRRRRIHWKIRRI